MMFRPLLLIFLIVNSDAFVFFFASDALQRHLNGFQQFVDAGDKNWLRVLMPVDHSKNKLDDFIKAHKSMKLTAKNATFISTRDTQSGNTQSGISGVVEYARGGRTILLEVVVEKSASSPTDYKFASIRTPPTCVLGLVACYLHLIDVLPGNAEEILVG